jgi:hypothetical protein
MYRIDEGHEMKSMIQNLLMMAFGLTLLASAGAQAAIEYKCLDAKNVPAGIRLENMNSTLRLTVLGQLAPGAQATVVEIGYENVKLLVGETRPAVGTIETIADKNNKYDVQLTTEPNPKNPKAPTRLTFNVVDKQSNAMVAQLRYCKLGK